ncbi:MAG: DUF6531 domain-containing protein [Pyrinomonadaceae bacterium]
MAILGRQSQNNSLLPIRRSSVKGFPIDFVSSSTGELAFAVTDLAFEDNPLLLFQRIYLSSRNEDFGLGRGWSFAFNDSIALNADNAVLTTAAGDSFAYRRDGAAHFILQNPDSADVKEFNVENGKVISAKNGDVTKIYQRTGNEYYLSQIAAPAGLEITINRSPNGQIRSISSISGEINLNWSNGGNNAKLLAVTDNTGRRVSFGQSNNLLQNTTSATGGEWHYEYADGKISRVIDPVNRIALGARYDANGRAAEFGDAANVNRLTYETNASSISTRTTVTDSLNYTRVFQHNERGNLTEVDDAGGILAKIGYDETNHPVQVTDANGAVQVFNYDAQQRLTRRQMPDGEKIFEYSANGKLAAVVENGERTELNYDGEGNLAEKRTRRNGKNVRTNFNRDGKIVHQEVENGLSMNFEYDNKGRETAFVYSDIGRFEKAFDAAGRKIAEKLPSGLTYNYEYNANNKVTRKSDNRGNGFRTEYDASGALTKLVRDNGAWSQIIRDPAGRIVEMRNSRGKSRRYSYNAHGALTEYIGADGRHFQFQYDARGTLQNVIQAQNAGLIYRRDQPENLFSIQKAGGNNIWQMQNISYPASVAGSKFDLSSANSIDSNCLFGGDGFSFEDPYSTDLTFGIDLQSLDPFNSCNDPFGGMGGFEVGGFGGQVTCEQCRQKNLDACNYDAMAKVAELGIIGIGIIIGCAWTTVGELVCFGVVIVLAVLGGIQIYYTREACIARIDNNCPQCNK